MLAGREVDTASEVEVQGARGGLVDGDGGAASGPVSRVSCVRELWAECAMESDSKQKNRVLKQ